MSEFRIPVTIFTGFLGAGKTTLLRDLIQRSRQRRLAILVNEFGEVSIDGALLREQSGAEALEIYDLAQGLIAYRDDTEFLPRMQALAARAGEIDHVIIETSGLALPSAVMEQLQSPALAADFVLDATLAVVDTPWLLEESDPSDAAQVLLEAQLQHADIVVLNKIDALTEADLLRAEEQVRGLAPSVRFLELAYKAQLDTRLTLGLHLHEANPLGHRHFGPIASAPSAATWRPLADQSTLNGHSHSGLAAHSHGLSTHQHFHEQDAGWQSFRVRSRDAQSPATLQAALEAITRAEPILRAKGFAMTADGDAITVQAVRHRVTLTTAARAKPLPYAELVVIGYHPSRTRVIEQLQHWTHSSWF